MQKQLPKVSKTLAQNQVSFKGLKLWEKIKTELKQMNWHNFKKIVKVIYKKITKIQMENAMNYYQK